MTTMRTRILILAFLAGRLHWPRSQPGKKAWTSSSPGPNPLSRMTARPCTSKSPSLKAKAADKLYNDGNADAGKAALQDVVAYSKKATDAAIATGKKLKNVEITLRKMAEKFRDIKRTVAFDDQAPLQQAVDGLEKMRTDLLSAMFGKKKGK